MTCGAAIALLTVALAAATVDEPRTFGELQRSLGQRSTAARVASYRKFAQDRRPAINDRVRAAQALVQAIPGDDRRQIGARLLQARLCGVAERGGCRSSALWQARKAAKQHDDARLDAISGALAGDRALEALARAMRRRQKRPPGELAGKERQLLEQVESALAHYEALEDGRQSLRARFHLAAILESTPADRQQVLAQLDALTGADPEDRDAALIRADIQRVRARLLADLGRWQDAAAAALAADRAAASSPRKAAFESSPPASQPVPGKSRETMLVCYRARVAQRVDCAQLEQHAYGSVTYYDFGREPRQAGFNSELGAMAAAEYGPLIQSCIQAVADGGQVQNTHLEVTWSIGHDGRVKDYELLPTRLRDTDFSRCLDLALKKFRYPAYGGEMQHTSLRFEIEE